MFQGHWRAKRQWRTNTKDREEKWKEESNSVKVVFWRPGNKSIKRERAIVLEMAVRLGKMLNWAGWSLRWSWQEYFHGTLEDSVEESRFKRTQEEYRCRQFFRGVLP